MVSINVALREMTKDSANQPASCAMVKRVQPAIYGVSAPKKFPNSRAWWKDAIAAQAKSRRKISLRLRQAFIGTPAFTETITTFAAPLQS